MDVERKGHHSGKVKINLTFTCPKFIIWSSFIKRVWGLVYLDYLSRVRLKMKLYLLNFRAEWGLKPVFNNRQIFDNFQNKSYQKSASTQAWVTVWNTGLILPTTHDDDDDDYFYPKKLLTTENNVFLPIRNYHHKIKACSLPSCPNNLDTSIIF